MIEILASGVLNTVQDLGRPGWLASGVSFSGAMDRPALETANALLGNAPDAAGIEVQLFPFRLRSHFDTDVAVTGADCEAAIDEVPLPPWWAARIRPGQTLSLSLPRSGARAYVAFAGGIDVPAVLGSRSTNVRVRFGGLEGRGLSRGNRIELVPPRSRGRIGGAGLGAVPPARAADHTAPAVVRVLAAAEHHLFDEPSLRAFAEEEWTVTAEANRMGYRLSGPSLRLDRPVELFSHGIMPGTVQVPPAGQPIVQLADANTCGGYPKIAAVIETDLWRFAQAPVGTKLRFVLVDEHTAVEALREQARWMDELAATRAAFTGA